MLLHKYSTFFGFFDAPSLLFSPPSSYPDSLEFRPTLDFGVLREHAVERAVRLIERNIETFQEQHPGIQAKELEAVAVSYATAFANRIMRDPTAFRAGVADIFRSNVDNIGILSLCERADDRRMWDQYGGGGTGFMLSLESEAAILQPRPSDLLTCGEVRPVAYSDEQPVVRVHPDLLDIPQQLFWRKALDYRDEREWRIIRQLSTADRVEGSSHLWELGPGDLTEVVFGTKVDRETVERRAEQIGKFDPDITTYSLSIDHEGQLIRRRVACS